MNTHDQPKSSMSKDKTPKSDVSDYKKGQQAEKISSNDKKEKK